jgi:glycosyltransferase involved in cell wall biosynthesis
MTEKGRQLLQSVYGADPSRIDVIPHGIPEFRFPDPEEHKEWLGLDGHRVLLSFGLVSPNKGLEVAIKALPIVASEFPNILYVIVGQTHPQLIRETGESYRDSLVALAKECGVEDNILWINRFLELNELMQYIAACDMYVTPYLHEAQITSGTLSYAYGMGTPVVSTPYWHANDLLADGRGVLVPFKDSEALGNAIAGLLRDDKLRETMRRNAFEQGRTMTWSRVAEMYLDSFQKAREGAVNGAALLAP